MFQSTVALAMGFGVQGELEYDGPYRAAPWTITGNGGNGNVVGATAYTVVSDGFAVAGGTGSFAGILAAPKSYALYGSSLTPSMTLADYSLGELVTMGQMNVLLSTAANIGDFIVYNTTTGALSSVSASFAATASFATNVMTVTGTPPGSIGVGSAVNGANIPPGTVVSSLGSGTGGAGTYNLSTSPGTVASETVTIGAGTNAGTGNAFVPHAKVVLRASAANGLAIIELTD